MRSPAAREVFCSVRACELDRNRRSLGRDQGDLVSRFAQSRGEQPADPALFPRPTATDLAYQNDGTLSGALGEVDGRANLGGTNTA